MANTELETYDSGKKAKTEIGIIIALASVERPPPARSVMQDRRLIIGSGNTKTASLKYTPCDRQASAKGEECNFE